MKNKFTISIVILVFILILIFIFLFQKFYFSEETIIEKEVTNNTDYQKLNFGKIKLTNEVHLSWSIKEFDEKFHKIEYCESIDAKYICKIDDKDWYGSDFKMDLPKNELENLSIYINNIFIKLDESQIYNPNNSGELNKNQFKLEKQTDFYILYAYFSDGAGTYTTKWKIKGNKSERSKLSNDEQDFEWQNN